MGSVIWGSKGKGQGHHVSIVVAPDSAENKDVRYTNTGSEKTLIPNMKFIASSVSRAMNV